MRAVMKKELRQYFTSLIGYVYLGIFYLFSGFYFFTSVLLPNSTDLSFVFTGLFQICLFAIPVLTMRTFSEERKNRTDQALLTSPVSLLALVCGKYFSALTVYVLGTAQTLLFAGIVDFMAGVEWAIVLGNFIGLFLLGAALTAVGVFVSSLTENQMIAAVGGMSVGLLLILMQGLAQILPDGLLRSLVTGLSFSSRYQRFTRGIVSLADIAFFISVCAVFLFLTTMRLEGGRKYQIRGVRDVRGVITLLNVLLFMASAVVFYKCAGKAEEKFGLAFDLTREKVFELSEQSKEFIASVEKPVEIGVMMDAYTLESGGGYFAQAKEIIEQYPRYNEKVTVRYVDLVKNPVYAREYPELSLNYYDIVLSCEGRVWKTTLTDLFHLRQDAATGERYIVSSKADQVLTSAIMRLVSDKLTEVTLLVGHDEAYTEEMIGILENNGYRVTKRNPLTEGFDMSADVVISLAPMQDYEEETLKELEAYLENAGEYGKTFLYAPPTVDSTAEGGHANLETFLARRGIRTGSGVVMESDAGYILDNLSYMCLADYSSEEYLDRMATGAKVVSPLGREIRQEFTEKNGYVTDVLLSYSPGSFVMPWDAPGDWSPAREDFGTHPALIRSQYASFDGQREKKSSVFVFAAAGYFEGSILQSTSAANADYFVALLNEVTQKADMIVPAPKTIGGRSLGVTLLQVYGMGLFFVIIVPLAVMLAGAVIRVRRKRR